MHDLAGPNNGHREWRKEMGHRLAEPSWEAAALTDLNCTILGCNEQAAELLGFEHTEDLVGRSTFDFFVPEDVGRAVRNARLTLKTGAVRRVPYTVLTSDGTRLPIELSASLVRDPTGRPQAFTAVLRPVADPRDVAAAVPYLHSDRDYFDPEATDAHRSLTPRESEVLILLLEGRSNKEIATELVVAVKTVEFHVSRIFSKLGVRSRIAAISSATEVVQQLANAVGTHEIRRHA